MIFFNLIFEKNLFIPNMWTAKLKKSKCQSSYVATMRKGLFCILAKTSIYGYFRRIQRKKIFTFNKKKQKNPQNHRKKKSRKKSQEKMSQGKTSHEKKITFDIVSASFFKWNVKYRILNSQQYLDLVKNNLRLIKWF